VVAQGTLVAVRSLDKQLRKGRTFDFRPNRDFFHLEEAGGTAPVRIPIRNLKGIFFLKSLGRSPSCVDKRSFGEHMGTEQKVWLEFRDGEKLAGWSNSFGSRRDGFYVFPADPDSNLEKAYVFRSALSHIEEGDAAEAASRAFYASCPEPEPPPAGTPAAPEDAGTYRLTRSDLRSSGRGGEKI
jgi:hypothetical protein